MHVRLQAAMPHVMCTQQRCELRRHVQRQLRRGAAAAAAGHCRPAAGLRRPAHRIHQLHRHTAVRFSSQVNASEC